MFRVTVAAVGFCLLMPAAGAAAHQAVAPQQAPQAAGQKPKPSAPVEPSDAAAQAPGLLRIPSQAVNIRLEVTITDQRGSTTATPKTVTMLVADRYLGRIRTSGTVRVGTTYEPIALNVDAQPEILKDGRIRVQVTLEYRAQAAEGAQENQPNSLTESFNVILDDGKSMLVTQSADPGSDRRVRVELKAAQVK